MVGVSKEWSLRADSDLLSALCVCSGEPFAVREFVLFFAILILLHRMFLDFFFFSQTCLLMVDVGLCPFVNEHG